MSADLTILDLFSAACGGWSLGMHRAGFTTIAACEWIAWRRALYAENNPGVPIYEDVRDVTAERLYRDLGTLPWGVVGSPPCQDISSANTKGKGVDGERSVLFFEAIRIAGEIRALARKLGIPGARWVALENSSNLRNRGSDRVLAALEAAGYPCEPTVVGAGDDFRTSGRKHAGVGANHERARSWLLAYDPEQLADPHGAGRPARRSWGRSGFDLSVPHDPVDAAEVGHAGGRPWGHGPDGDGAPSTAPGREGPSDAQGVGRSSGAGNQQSERSDSDGRSLDDSAGNGAPSHARDAAGDGCGPGRPGRRAEPTAGLSEPACGHADAVEVGPEGVTRSDERGQGKVAEHPVHALSGHGPHANEDGEPDGAEHDEVGGREGAGGDASGPWSDWNGGLASHLRVDDGLSAWVAGTRVAVGDGKGVAAASLIVEAFGDAVVPQIPEAIGRAILRTEAALEALLSSGRAA